MNIKCPDCGTTINPTANTHACPVTHSRGSHADDPNDTEPCYCTKKDKETETTKNKETADAEFYFIQLLFCDSRELLRKENRKLYDVMLERYETIYKQGRFSQIDLGDINKKFLAIFEI